MVSGCVDAGFNGSGGFFAFVGEGWSGRRDGGMEGFGTE